MAIQYKNKIQPGDMLVLRFKFNTLIYIFALLEHVESWACKSWSHTTLNSTSAINNMLCRYAPPVLQCEISTSLPTTAIILLDMRTLHLDTNFPKRYWIYTLSKVKSSLFRLSQLCKFTIPQEFQQPLPLRPPGPALVSFVGPGWARTHWSGVLLDSSGNNGLNIVHI